LGAVTSRSRAASSARAAATIRWVSSANGRTYRGFFARVLASVSWSVHWWMSRMGVQGDAHAQLDRLREDDLLLGREQRHARDLAQVQARGVLDVERLLVDDLCRLVVGIRGRGRGCDHRRGLRRLGLGGLRRELLVARLRDGVERQRGNELRLGRLDPFGSVVDKGDQGDSTGTGRQTATPPGADVDDCGRSTLRRGRSARTPVPPRAGHTLWRVKS
jgi:hypothetical protein